MNKALLVIFLGIIIIGSSSNFSSINALPENLPEVSKAPGKVRIIEGENITAYARALYTTIDNPANHVKPSSDPHDGVAKLILVTELGTFGCSGSLASDRIHVITAAHCITDDYGIHILTSGSATFEGNSDSITVLIDPVNSFAHPDYDGDFIKGNDIAMLKLETSVPSQVPAIPHATLDNSVGQVVDKTGFGWSGYQSSGADVSTYPFGIKRVGQNIYDNFADTMYQALGLSPGSQYVPQSIYQYDSDDGTSSHDAFDFFFNDSGLGLGNDEVISAPGDSGGPTIRNGELVGVTSYGISLEFSRGPPPRTSDCTTEGLSPLLDSSCGEFAGDTRVSYFSDWIDSNLTPIDDTTAPPTLDFITITPDSASIQEESTQQFTVTGTYSDFSTQELLADSWGSSDTSVATIEGDGLAIGILAGSTTITATYDTFEDTTILTVNSAPEEPTTVSVSSINYSTYGGKDNSKHLDIAITIIDNLDAAVSGASVSIDLLRDGDLITSSTGTTTTEGKVTFSLKNAASGHYVTDVTNVIASGLTFVDDYADSGFDKQ